MSYCGTCKHFKSGWNSQPKSADAYTMKGICERPRHKFKTFEMLHRLFKAQDFDCSSGNYCDKHEPKG